MSILAMASVLSMGQWDWRHVAILGAIGVLCLWVLQVSYKRRQYSFYKLQGPPNQSPILGNLPSFIGIGVGAAPVAWLKTYGLTHYARLALSQRVLVTVDKAALGYILRNVDLFPKQKPLRRQLARYLDNGIVVAEGDTHRRQKKMLAGSFAPGMVRAFQGLFLEQSYRLKERWLGLCTGATDKISIEDQEHAGAGVQVDVLNFVMNWSMDVIGQAGFGHDMGGLAEKRNALAMAFEASVRNFGRISPAWVVQSMVPFFDYIPNPVTWQMNANKAATRRLSKEIFEEKRSAVLAQGRVSCSEKAAWGKDILSNLLRANMSPDVEGKDRLPDEQVIAQIGTLLLAGKANSAFAATWCLYELAQNPSVQHRLREELMAVTSDQPDRQVSPYLIFMRTDRLVSMRRVAADHHRLSVLIHSDTLAALPYLDAVMRESLRLHPSVPQTMRVATRDAVIPLARPVAGVDGEVIDTVELPKGTTVVIPIAYANRSEELWGPTANTFDPDRFLHEKTNHGEFEGSPGMWGRLLTFIDGPRGCIGYRFALAEIRALLFVLLRSFELEPVDGVEIISWYAIKNQPVVKGHEKQGMQLPLIVKPLH